MTRKRSRPIQKSNKKSKKKEIIIGMILVFVIISISIAGIYANQPKKSNDKIWGNAPDFTLSTIDDETFTLSDNYGKIILIDLMAAWCTWCLPQMEELDAVSEEKGNEIVIISVGVDQRESFNDIQDTFGKYTDKWTFVLDNNDENVATNYDVNGIPRLVFINKEGDVAFSHEGLISKEDIINEINNIK